MINRERWINSLPGSMKKFENSTNHADHEKWINTIPLKKENYNYVKKYSLAGILFIFGLLLVSAIKNETRNLQREINNLEASVDIIKFNLHQATLDNEVLTSPENISLLAKEHLNIDLASYKKGQIKYMDKDEQNIVKIYQTNKKENVRKKVKNLPVNVKKQVAKRIENKKKEIAKLKDIYSDPTKTPDELKIQLAKQIEIKKLELKNIYQNPQDTITLAKVGKWSAIQVVKAFLGMPAIPGK